MNSGSGKIVYGSGGVKSYFIGDREVTQAEWDNRFPSRLELGKTALPGATTTGWPLKSVALAVQPKQVDAANARARRHGLKSYYERDGTAVLPSREERKKLCRLEGVHDNSGGYGDA